MQLFGWFGSTKASKLLVEVDDRKKAHLGVR